MNDRFTLRHVQQLFWFYWRNEGRGGENKKGNNQHTTAPRIIIHRTHRSIPVLDLAPGAMHVPTVLTDGRMLPDGRSRPSSFCSPPLNERLCLIVISIATVAKYEDAQYFSRSL